MRCASHDSKSWVQTVVGGQLKAGALEVFSAACSTHHSGEQSCIGVGQKDQPMLRPPVKARPLAGAKSAVESPTLRVPPLAYW